MHRKTKIYMDCCCYNRPYDGQTQSRIRIETVSKMRIQRDIVEGKYALVTSVVLYHENSRNPNHVAAEHIESYMDMYGTEYVDEMEYQHILGIRDGLQEGGLKMTDAGHVACAISRGCKYFITTDDRILRFKDDRINIINPVDFVLKEGGKE